MNDILPDIYSGSHEIPQLAQQYCWVRDRQERHLYYPLIVTESIVTQNL
jgi:hypothetical protein